MHLQLLPPVRLLLRSPLQATEPRLVAHFVCPSALQLVSPRAPGSAAGTRSSTFIEGMKSPCPPARISLIDRIAIRD